MTDQRVFVGDLTRKEFRQRMEQGIIKAAVVPTAATEQHNEHLEMIHDTLHVTYMAEKAAARLHPQVVVATPIGIGVSEHWMEHKGTLTGYHGDALADAAFQGHPQRGRPPFGVQRVEQFSSVRLRHDGGEFRAALR